MTLPVITHNLCLPRRSPLFERFCSYMDEADRLREHCLAQRDRKIAHKICQFYNQEFIEAIRSGRYIPLTEIYDDIRPMPPTNPKPLTIYDQDNDPAGDQIEKDAQRQQLHRYIQRSASSI